MKSKRRAGLLVAAMSALLAMAILAPMAQAKEPNATHKQFTGCPSPEEFPGVNPCVHTIISGGHFQMGSKDVPIEHPLSLTGGFLENGAIVANSKGGLPPVKQKVPGGVIGLTGLTWLAEFLGIEALTLYATTELAGGPVLNEGILNLPIKIHLSNAALGNNCYVGSVTNPIQLHLTVGTTSPPPPNKPISGHGGTFSFNEATEVVSETNGEYVDNSFSAPGASGCVLTLFGFIPISINGLVNSQSGLPSPAGKNETRQKYTIELAEPSAVF
jgi:hypothetical protein